MMNPSPPEQCAGITRRRFLAAIGAGAAMVAAGPYGVSVWGRNPALAGASPPPGALGALHAGRSLVIIELGGGNDGLNMVVPHGMSRYYDLRAAGAVTDPLDIDGEIGLHPALTYLAAEYDSGRLAIIEGIGYPDPQLSHFSSMSTWWSGAPEGQGRTGWLGRHLDGLGSTSVGEASIGGVSIGPGPSPILLGERVTAVSIQDRSGLTPSVPAWIDSRDELVGMWSGFAPPTITDASLFGRVQQAIAATASVTGSINATLAGAPTADEAHPAGSLAAYLDVAAALVLSDQPPPAIVIHGWGDFDTHQGMESRHGALMAELNAGLESFFGTLSTGGGRGRALVMTTSEFGRRATYNGSGTDHGTAGSHFVLGDVVVGGRYGAAPSLSDLDSRGNLKHQVDYRSVYATILEDWIGGDAAETLSHDYANLGFLSVHEMTHGGALHSVA